MTFPSDKTLINYERMSRQVICLNPTHSPITIYTNETQPQCPICTNVMVSIIKSALTGEVIDTPREK